MSLLWHRLWPSVQLGYDVGSSPDNSSLTGPRRPSPLPVVLGLDVPRQIALFTEGTAAQVAGELPLSFVNRPNVSERLCFGPERLVADAAEEREYAKVGDADVLLQMPYLCKLPSTGIALMPLALLMDGLNVSVEVALPSERRPTDRAGNLLPLRVSAPRRAEVVLRLHICVWAAATA